MNNDSTGFRQGRADCWRWRVLLVLSLVVTGLFTGCKTAYIAPNAFEEYAENVFIRQNQMTGEVMMLSEEELSEKDYEILTDAESRMLEACKDLNEYAVHVRDGLSIGLYLRHSAMNSTEERERATQDMEMLLDRIENGQRSTPLP